MKNLVQLNMSCSRISRFGEGFKNMKNLKSLNLNRCKFLVQSPDLSGSPNLEFLDLSWCTSLKKIHPSIGSLQKLVELDLERCSNLVTLPQKVNCRSLETLNLSACKLLAQSPDLSGSPNLEFLDLSWCTSLKKIHPSIGSLQKLVELDLRRCSNLVRLPGEVNWRSLETLNLSACELLAQSPDLSGSPNLEYLDLSYCESLVEVHPAVGSLKKLVNLNLERCSNLVRLPGEVNWRSLRSINLDYCTRLESFPEIEGEMKYMTRLRLWHTGIKALPLSIGYLINLRKLELQDCGNLTDLPCGIYELQKLKTVQLYDCPKLVRFPNKVESEVLPTYSKVSHDNRDSSTLRKLDLSGSAIVILPECINKFVNLRRLNLTDCTRLVEIPKLPPSIRRLWLRDCVSLERISKLSNILERKESQMIEEMDLTNCWRFCQNLVEMANKDDDDEVHADLFSRLLSSQQSKFTITFPVPRSEVPKWFSSQMDFMGHRRFEFYIETLTNFKWDNAGLALCVAVDQKLHNPWTDFVVYIHINEVSVSDPFEKCVDSAESDHVLLHYVPFHEMWRLGYMHPLPPFTCRVIIYQTVYSAGSIKSCGVHLVMPPNEDVSMKLIRAENLTSELSHDEKKGNYRPKQRTDCKELYTDAQLENEKL